MVKLIPIESVQDLAQLTQPSQAQDKQICNQQQKINHYRGSIAIAQELGCTHLWVSKYEFGQQPELN